MAALGGTGGKRETEKDGEEKYKKKVISQREAAILRGYMRFCPLWINLKRFIVPKHKLMFR